ncbi:MAG: F0F1 ATP synthase subunit beta, partial [Bacteroidota bacterium]
MNKGKIVQVIGPVVDVDFSGAQLPAIYTALNIPRKDVEENEDILVVE